MTANKQTEDVRWLVQHRPADVRAVVRGFKRLTRGRRGEFGHATAYLVTLLEIGLEEERRRKRAKGRKAKTAAKTRAKTTAKTTKMIAKSREKKEPLGRRKSDPEVGYSG